MTNHELAHRYEAKSKILGKGEFKLRYLDEDKVELMEVLDKESTGRLIIPSFISGCKNYNVADCPLYGCSYNEVYVENREDIEFDASNLCAHMEPCGNRLKLQFKNPNRVRKMNYTFERVGGEADSIEVNVGNSVKSMIGTFAFCRNIKNIEIFGESTFECLVSMANMFEGCESLVGIDLSNIKTPKLLDMECAFRGCSSMLSVKTPRVSNSVIVRKIFDWCKELKAIDMGEIDISKVNGYNYMFDKCRTIESIEIGKASYDLLESIINNGVKEIIVHNKENYKDLLAIKRMWQTENINVEYKGEDE